MKYKAKTEMTSNNSTGPIKICHIATSHASIGNLFRGQHRFFNDHGFEVWAVSGPGPIAERAVEQEGIHFHPIKIKRSMDIWGDLKFLVKLIRFLRKEKFDIVETSTAKAGMIGMIAAWLVRVPVRIYTIRGAWYEKYTGIARKLASMTVSIPCALAHRVFSISQELLDMDVDEGVVKPEKVLVIANGSSNGVDTERFCHNEKTIAAGEQIRKEHNIPLDALVIGFAGRASIEKGVCELVEAFEKLDRKYAGKLFLMFVGGFDYMGGMIPQQLFDKLKVNNRVKCIDMVDDIENYYAAMDILAMPSYREGFGNVNIEAAAMGVPVVASNIYGCRESVSDGQSGILVEAKNSQALYEGLKRLIEDTDFRKQLSTSARQWVVENFDSDIVWAGLLKEYLKLYRQKRSC